jgi:hypothetical protein
MAITQVYADPNSSNRRNRQRIADAEQELNDLMQGKEPVEDEPVVVKPAAEVEAEPVDAEERSFKKRYGDLRRHMSEKEKEWEKKFESLQAQPTNQTILPPKSDEDIAEWSRKYPDVASIVETIAEKKANEKLSKYERQFTEYEQLTTETARNKALNAIRESHPDFDDLRKSDAFHNWADEQPKWVQDVLYENEEDARAVVRVIDLYKVDKGLNPAAKKASAKEAASSVTTKNKSSVDLDGGTETIRESEVAKMNMDTFAKMEKRIQAAMQSGTFVYDVTGGAR